MKAPRAKWRKFQDLKSNFLAKKIVLKFRWLKSVLWKMNLKIFFNPDYKKGSFFLIRIKKREAFFFGPDKKKAAFFWSGSNKKGYFLIRIKKAAYFWSGSKKKGIFFIRIMIFHDPDHEKWSFGSFWKKKLIHDPSTVLYFHWYWSFTITFKATFHFSQGRNISSRALSRIFEGKEKGFIVFFFLISPNLNLFERDIFDFFLRVAISFSRTWFS